MSIMYMLTPPYVLWSIWKSLSSVQRSFILLLCVVSIYSLFVALRTILRLRVMRKLNSNESIATIEETLAPLYRSLANTRQLIGATFYLFGFVLFMALQTVVITLGDAPTLLINQIFGNLVLDFAFAANVFFVFFALHVAQWIVFMMLNKCSIRLNARHMA